MKHKDAYLGLDLGGTGAKAGVFDRSGNLLGLGHQTYTPTVSPEGHVEIPIETIYLAARTAVGQALDTGGRPDVYAMAVVAQGQTFVSLDQQDQALHPAIIWYDSRAKEQARRLQEALTGHRPSGPVPHVNSLATAPKIMWLREHLPEALRRACRYLLLPDYLSYRLTGQAVIDANTAASTGLYAGDAPGYDSRALAAAQIKDTELARVQKPGSPIARLTRKAAAEWGLTANTLLITGTNDQYAGALGAGNCRPGILSETTGTAMGLVTLTESLPSPMPMGLYSGRFPIEKYKFILAYCKTAGVVLDWFRRELAANIDFESLNREAENSPIGSHDLTMFPHFDGRVSPAPNAAMRGAFLGLTLRHTRADLYRSILESLAFCLRENLEYLEQHGIPITVIRSIGGGAKNPLLLQIKADVIGRPVEQPAVTEAAVLGAAMLAAQGQGAMASLAETSAALHRTRRVFQPDAARHQAYQKHYDRHQQWLKILSQEWSQHEIT